MRLEENDKANIRNDFKNTTKSQKIEGIPYLKTNIKYDNIYITLIE